MYLSITKMVMVLPRRVGRQPARALPPDAQPGRVGDQPGRVRAPDGGHGGHGALPGHALVQGKATV